MKLYDAQSNNPMVVRLFALERGHLTFDTETIDLANLQNRRLKYRQINPYGTVPALVLDNGLVLSDMCAICEYMDEVAKGGESLFGGSREARAETRMWLRKIDQEIAQPLIAWWRNDPATIDFYQGHRLPVPEARMTQKLMINQALNQLEDDLEGKSWLCGERFSAADVHFAGGMGPPSRPKERVQLLHENGQKNFEHKGNAVVRRPCRDMRPRQTYGRVCRHCTTGSAYALYPFARIRQFMLTGRLLLATELKSWLLSCRSVSASRVVHIGDDWPWSHGGFHVHCQSTSDMRLIETMRLLAASFLQVRVPYNPHTTVCQRPTWTNVTSSQSTKAPSSQSLVINIAWLRNDSRTMSRYGGSFSYDSNFVIMCMLCPKQKTLQPSYCGLVSRWIGELMEELISCSLGAHWVQISIAVLDPSFGQRMIPEMLSIFVFPSGCATSDSSVAGVSNLRVGQVDGPVVEPFSTLSILY
nr:glutathione s-transferase gst-6.0 [Quercus suber]